MRPIRRLQSLTRNELVNTMSCTRMVVKRCNAKPHCVAEDVAPSHLHFAGLRNLGNSRYLNSVRQCIFRVPIHLHATQLHSDSIHRCIGKTILPPLSIGYFSISMIGHRRISNRNGCDNRSFQVLPSRMCITFKYDLGEEMENCIFRRANQQECAYAFFNNFVKVLLRTHILSADAEPNSKSQQLLQR